MTLNEELRQLYEDDQDDRVREEAGESNWDVIVPRDRARRKRALEIVELLEVMSGEECFYVAMLFQHGEGAEDFELAHAWAKRAMSLGFEKGKRMCAMTLDRWLLSQGKRQKFGTQYQLKDGKWKLMPVDGSVSDEVRAEYGVESLEEAMAWAEEMNV